MKQTALEKFIAQLEKQGDSWENASTETINISIKIDNYLKLKEQAKEMEKQQIIDAWIVTENELQRMAAEQYYNETFKSE